jgi:hypothetical protein
VSCAEFGTENGETISVAVLLSKTNVTVCGSATVEGLSHVTLWPTLTCICFGTNAANMSVAFPPPACTFIDVVSPVAVVLLLMAFITLKLVAVAISSIIDNAEMTATTVNMDFIVIGSEGDCIRYT